MLWKLVSFVCALIAIVLYYSGFEVDKISKIFAGSENGDVLFTLDELSRFDGVKSDLLYLSLLGRIYDVTKGRRHYEKGSGYHIFVGRDSSRAFVTGEFSESAKDLDDVMRLSPEELVGLEDWYTTFDEKYIYKGKLIGRYYDGYGRETDYTKRVRAKIEEGKIIKFQKAEADKVYPPCNSEWSADTGGRVWCTKKSGGIDRDWAGVPRLMHNPGLSAPICVCINTRNSQHVSNPQLKEYEGCDSKSSSCKISVGE